MSALSFFGEIIMKTIIIQKINEYANNKSRVILLFLIVLPIVISLFGVGYLPPRFNMMYKFSGIEGEGTVSSCLSTFSSISKYYEAKGEFYPELEVIRIPGYHYDVKDITLTWVDIDKVTIESCKIDIFGIPVGEYTAQQMLSKGLIARGTKVESDGESVTFDFTEAEEEGYVTFMGITPIPIWFWVAYFTLLLLVNAIATLVLYEIFAFLKIRKYGVLPEVSITLVSYIVGMMINGSLPYITYDYLFFNWLIIFAVAMLINALSFRGLGTTVVSAIVYLWSVANYYVVLYRGKPIMPSDLKAVGTVKQVIDGYDLTPTTMMVGGGLFLTVLLTVYIRSIIVEKKEEKERDNNIDNPSFKKRGIIAVLCAIVLFLSVHNPVYASLETFAWDVMLLENFNREGMILTYVKSALNSKLRKPDGYSRELIESYLKEYKGAEQMHIDGTKPTNIIMVMNEAFSDLRDSGMDESIDVMPFVDSLKENTMSGSLYVSVYAGGTCNTEFEALTGNTLAYFPSGVYPYTENVTESMFSLADYFSKKDYYTAAFHPQEANNWNRENVYPLLSFDEFFSLEDYTGVDEIRGKASDISNYKFVEGIDDEHSEEPRFLFNVTLQNHSDYETWDNLTKAEGINSVPTKDLQVYLSLIKESDNAVKQLVETYQDSDEPTMIVFFGDHQPGLDPDSQAYVYGQGKEQLNMYKSDFFIWTNYDTEEVENVEVSANYLPYLILDRANCELPPYCMMLKDIYEKYPIITAQGVRDANGNYFYSVDELATSEFINKYRYVQYANVVGDLDDVWFDVK